MKRFNVTYKEPVLHKDQIEKYKNFDQLLHRHQALSSGKKGLNATKAVISGMVLLLSGACFWFYLNNYYTENPKPQINTERDFSQPASPKVEEWDDQEKGNREESETASLPQEKTEIREEVIEEAVKVEKESPRPLQNAPVESARNTMPESAEEETAILYKEAFPVAGMLSLYEYFNENLMYPAEELDAQVEGTVILSFSINAAGKAENIEVVQSVSPGIDLEAVRLIEEMPEWKPATVKGKAVSSRVTLPVSFKIVK